MPQVSISPVFNGFQFFDSNGEPLNGGKLFQYEGGSNSVQRTTYADNTGAVPNPNPIVLDSSGRITADLWLENGLAYNLVVTLADGTTVIDQVDNVIGVQASVPGGNTGISLWNGVQDTPNYISATSFSLPGNYTIEFAVGNRVKAELNANVYRYGTVQAVTSSLGNTIVTIVVDSGSLSGLLSAVSWSANISNGRTIDAAAVAYNTPAQYTNANTAGYQIKTNNDAITSLNSRYVASQQVWTTSGTNNYTLTINPPITSYTTDAIYVVRFGNASTGGQTTLNINGVGVAELLAYNTSGVGYYPNIVAGQVSQVAYNGAQFILLDPVQIAGSNTIWLYGYYPTPGSYVYTVPTGVYSLKVTVVGGGGGASQINPNVNPNFGVQSAAGGNGGAGFTYWGVTPGQQYAIAVGAGGLGGADSVFGPPYFPASGTAGGTSSFGGGILVATGGQPGNANTGAPGQNGSVTGSAVAIGIQPPFAPTLNVPFFPESIAPGVGGRSPGTGWYPGYYPNPNIAGSPAGEPGGAGFVLIEALQGI